MDAKRGVDFIGVTVCFVVHDGNKKFLLQKRSMNCRDEQGRWDVGGGALEFGEEWTDAVAREVYEELGTKAKKIEFIKAYNAIRDNNGVPTHWVALVHAVQVDPGTVKINEPDKIDEIGWFNMSSLPKPLHSKMMLSLEAAASAGIIE